MDETADVQKIHQIVLDIYKEFKNICEKNKIRFFAISGTTLGAVYWKGIIPWDDDIDIAMPAEDYLQFVKLCKKGVLSKHLHFTEYIWFGGKIHDDRTMFTNAYYLNNPDFYTGVSMDVVPLINVPDKKEEQKKFMEDLINFHKAGVLYERYGILEGYSRKKELFSKRDYFLKKYKFGETKHIVDYSDHRYVLEMIGFEKPIMMDFEDTTVPVSSNYEGDIKIQYKNFQKYPPKEKRASIHQKMSILDLEKSYLKYADAFLKSSAEIKEIISAMHAFEGFCEHGIYYRDDIINNVTRDYNNAISENEKLRRRLDERFHYLKKVKRAITRK